MIASLYFVTILLFHHKYFITINFLITFFVKLFFHRHFFSHQKILFGHIVCVTNFLFLNTFLPMWGIKYFFIETFLSPFFVMGLFFLMFSCHTFSSLYFFCYNFYHQQLFLLSHFFLTMFFCNNFLTKLFFYPKFFVINFCYNYFVTICLYFFTIFVAFSDDREPILDIIM